MGGAGGTDQEKSVRREAGVGVSQQEAWGV